MSSKPSISSLARYLIDVVVTFLWLAVSEVNQVLQSSKVGERIARPASSLLLPPTDSFLRRSMRYAVELPFYEGGSPPDVIPSAGPCRLDGSLPIIEVCIPFR